MEEAKFPGLIEAEALELVLPERRLTAGVGRFLQYESVLIAVQNLV